MLGGRANLRFGEKSLRRPRNSLRIRLRRFRSPIPSANADHPAAFQESSRKPLPVSDLCAMFGHKVHVSRAVAVSTQRRLFRAATQFNTTVNASWLFENHVIRRDRYQGRYSQPRPLGLSAVALPTVAQGSLPAPSGNPRAHAIASQEANPEGCRY
jgi:hypothetical protein